MLIRKRSDYYKIPLARTKRLDKIAKKLGRDHIWYSDSCDHYDCLCLDLLRAEHDNVEADASMILGGTI